MLHPTNQTNTSHSVETTPQEQQAKRSFPERAALYVRWGRQWLQQDWQGARYGSLGFLVLLISSLIILAYYINHPTPETYPDTADYLRVSHQIMTSGKLVDLTRGPGYPVFITLIFLLAGQENLAAVSSVQGGLFVLTVLEIYIITCILTRRAWMGLIVGLIVASNTYLLTFIKPVLSEGFSIWIVTTLTLVLLLFIHTLRIKYFWLTTALILLAFMTHPEWAYAPVLLFPFLLLVATRRGRFRRLVPHVIAAALLLYGVLGLYIYENATLNGYAGISVVQRINLLGKIMQYNMQNEAPPQYAALTQKINTYTGPKSPYSFANVYPEVTANNWALPDAYATTIISQHPIEFAMKTSALFFTSLTNHYHESQVIAQGPFGKELVVLDNLSLKIVLLYQLFPLFALIWLGLLFWPRTARSRQVEMMVAPALIGLYELVLTSSGGYGAFARLHTAFNPLLMIVVCTSLLLIFPLSARLIRQSPFLTTNLAKLWPSIWWVGGGILAACILASAILTLLKRGAAALGHLHLWSGFPLVWNAPVLPGVLFGLIALLAYNVYQARRLQGAQPPFGGVENTHLPDSATPL